MTFNNTNSDINYLVETLNACERRISISVPANEVKKIQKTYIDQLASKRMDGYRPGSEQAKRSVAKLYKDAIEAHTQEKLIQNSFGECLKKESLKPASQPVFTDLKIESGQNFRYTVTMEVYPSIPCPTLTDTTLEVWETSITEEEVTQELTAMQSSTSPSQAAETETSEASESNSDPEGPKHAEEAKRQLRLQVHQWMESRAQNKQRIQLKQRLIETLLVQNPVSELPSQWLEQHYLQLKHNKTRTQNTATEALSETEEQALRAQAKRDITLNILFEAYATQQNIQLEGERVNKSLAEITVAFQHQPEQLERLQQDKNFINLLCSQVLEEQIIDHLLEHVTLVKKPISYTKLMHLDTNQGNHTNIEELPSHE